jgi:two-component system sensor histidine kinase VicK
VALAKNENLISLEAIYEESQVRFKTIFEQSKLGNKIITSDFKILKVNNALQQMLGYIEQKLIGTTTTVYAHPDFIELWHELQHNLWTKQKRVYHHYLGRNYPA